MTEIQDFTDLFVAQYSISGVNLNDAIFLFVASLLLVITINFDHSKKIFNFSLIEGAERFDSIQKGQLVRQ